MKKIILNILIITLCILAASCERETTNYETETTKIKTETQTETQNTIAIEINDDEIMDIIKKQEIDIVGSWYRYDYDEDGELKKKYLTTKEDKRSNIKATFENIEILNKNNHELDNTLLVVEFKATVQNLTCHSEEKQNFSITLDTKNAYSVDMISKQSGDIIIAPNVEFNKEFFFEQGLTVKFYVDEDEFNTNNHLYMLDGATSEFDGLMHRYLVSLPVNHTTVKDFEITQKGNDDFDKFDGSFMQKRIHYRIKLSSDISLKTGGTLEYVCLILPIGESSASPYVNTESKDYEYWNFGSNIEDETWGVRD